MILIEKLTKDIINFHTFIKTQYNPIGGLQLMIYDDYVYITNIYVSDSYRGKGYASKLITRVCEFLEEEHSNITIVKLDDLSDYCRNPKCIYLKWGLQYNDDICSEMTGKICNIPRRQ
tara:strand:+ start:165 stop:518 length:354 start_codon:yes stop_codon:yes gene_type:complete